MGSEGEGEPWVELASAARGITELIVTDDPWWDRLHKALRAVSRKGASAPAPIPAFLFFRKQSCVEDLSRIIYEATLEGTDQTAPAWRELDEPSKNMSRRIARLVLTKIEKR